MVNKSKHRDSSQCQQMIGMILAVFSMIWVAFSNDWLFKLLCCITTLEWGAFDPTLVIYQTWEHFFCLAHQDDAISMESDAKLILLEFGGLIYNSLNLKIYFLQEMVFFT